MSEETLDKKTDIVLTQYQQNNIKAYLGLREANKVSCQFTKNLEHLESVYMQTFDCTAFDFRKHIIHYKTFEQEYLALEHRVIE